MSAACHQHHQDVSRRRFLRSGAGALAGLSAAGILAACSSATDVAEAAQADDTRIVLGGDEPAAEPTLVPEAAVIETAPSAGEASTDRPPAENVSFTYLDGGGGEIADFAGTPLVVNFFASWCAPCRAELPEFQEAFERHNGDVEFLGFSVADEQETTRELLAETGVTFRIGLDPDESIRNAMGGFAMPTTVFIDRDSNVASGRIGRVLADDLEALIQEIL